MSIQIDSVRIKGFRGLENVELTLEKTTILTGMNNSGKTSFLKAIQLALGNRQFVSHDDFFIKESSTVDTIIVDLLIVPTNGDGERIETFSEDWEILFTTDRIQNDSDGKAFIPLRTTITFDVMKNIYHTEQYILQTWPKFKDNHINWYDLQNGTRRAFHFDEVLFFYVDAQRDILEDTKLRTSYLGKMLSKIEYSKEDVESIEKQISSLNEMAVSSSDVLSNIKTALNELDTAMDTNSEGIEVTPFTKKIRDLSKGLTIYYTDSQDSFSMEYHGMGTRSWSSLLTLKAFISYLSSNATKDGSVFYPILAIEEPEAHLHPNAQKMLYRQIDDIPGQKIISTHSPYIPGAAKLSEVRNFHKNGPVTCGMININNLTSEDRRKITRQVVNTRGELFFSKMIIFCEGETEEQGLPIFAHKYFNKTHVNLGVDFIGVGGVGNYLPFLYFAESLKIPWLIFSDAENTPDKNIIASVRKQLTECGTTKSESDCVVFLDEGNDYEKQLIKDGYQDEIKEAILSCDVYENEQHRLAKEPGRISEIKALDDDKLYDTITRNKTQYGPAISEIIVKQGRDIPPKVIELFEKVSTMLGITMGTE